MKKVAIVALLDKTAVRFVVTGSRGFYAGRADMADSRAERLQPRELRSVSHVKSSVLGFGLSR